MTYQLPELMQTNDDDTIQHNVSDFVHFTNESIAKAQALIREGQAAQAQFNQLTAHSHQPISDISNRK